MISVLGSMTYIFFILCMGIIGNSIVYSVIIMILFNITIEGNLKDRILITLKVYLINICLGYITQMLICIICNIRISSLQNGDWLKGYSILLLILFIIAFIKKSNMVRINDKAKNKILRFLVYFFMCIMGISIPMTISGLGYASFYVDNEKFNYICDILSIFAFGSVAFLLLFVFYINDINKKMKNSLETEKILMEIQKNYYEEMLKKEEETRKFRHDYINHLVCLKGLAEKEEKQKITDYIGQLEHHIMSIKPTYYTVGNDVIDILINGLIPQLKDAKVTIKGKCTENIDINYIELCTIVSNLIQNAIEELNDLNQDSKYFKMHIFQGNKNIKMVILNTSKMKVANKNNNLPMTSKKNKKEHGIGLKNVKEMIEKNHGKFFWEYAEGEFKVEIVLPLVLKDDVSIKNKC